MIDFIKELYNKDKSWNRKHPKLYKGLIICVILLLILNISIRFIISYTELMRKLNESSLSTKISEINLSADDKFREFEFIFETLTQNMPSISLFKERYSIDFKENYEKYSSYVSNTKDDFDYYCTLAGIFADIPSAHTDMLYPDYEAYKNYCSYNYDRFFATWNLKNYTDYWHELIEEKVRECYYEDYYIFNYYNGDGKYFFNPDMGIALETDEYVNSYLIAIDDVPVDEYIKDNIMYAEICYDNFNNKVFRSEIMFNSVSDYGRKVTASICLDDGRKVEKELYMSCADDLIIYHGCMFDERYTDDVSEQTGSQENGVPYYFYEDTENDLTYAWVSSVGYGFGETIKKSLSEIKTDNIILDLRDNGGGIAYEFYDYLYTPLFNNSYTFTNNYYISETPLNKKNIYKYNLFYDIYRAINFPLDYYEGNEFNVFDIKYKVVEESNHFNCEGGEGDANVYVLVGRNTASAADGFASVIKQGTNAVLIGENTAGEGMGSSYVSVALPKSKLGFTYYPALSFNEDGTNNSVYGTTPHYYAPQFSLDDFITRNNMLNEYGNGYAYAYENRIKWDSPLKYTVDMIKEDENDKGNNTADE